MKIEFDRSLANISDIHFGKKPNAAALYNELHVNFIEWCLVNMPDIIVVAGDLTDRKLYVNSEAAYFCNKFMHDLYELSQKGIAVLIVHGTLSHENYQILSYSHYVGENFRLYTKACNDYVKGMKFLVLPEEYVENEEEYYGQLLNEKESYDFCIGHGMFRHAGGYATDSVDGNNKKHSVTWKAKDFNKIIRGRVNFGHIHTRVTEEKVDYNGSFSRLNFGESEDKGFFHYNYSTKSGKCEKTFIINDLAPKYTTYIISPDKAEDSGFAPDWKRTVVGRFSSGDELLTFIKDSSRLIDFLRIMPDMDSDNPLYHSILAISRELPNVSLHNKLVKRNLTQLVSLEETDIEKEERLKREKYKGMHFLDVTKKYALEEFNEVLTDDVIQNAMKLLS